MKLFSFDNPQVKEATANSEDELQQVVVDQNKNGLPSYQESVAASLVRNKVESLPQVHKPPPIFLVYENEQGKGNKWEVELKNVKMCSNREHFLKLSVICKPMEDKLIKSIFITK